VDKDILKERTKKFALAIIEFSGRIPRTRAGLIIEDQLLRSGTSVGSNYRSIRTAKSSRDFINKLNIVFEEADETQYWLELLLESNLMKEEDVLSIYDEARQITAMTVASIKTAKSNCSKRI
jgi:four helix bundle protein